MAPPAHSSRTPSQRKVPGLPKKVSSSANSEPSPAKNKEHKRKAKATAEEYPLRSILDETENSYLIDWEDNSRTGESYEPTWEPKRNANETAIADWEQKKLKKSTTVIADSQSGLSVVETSQDSQPIRTAKRKRERRESPVLSEPLRKRGRKTRKSRNTSQRLQTGFSRKVPELELEVEEGGLVPTSVEDEVEETNQEDRILTSDDSIQALINQKESTTNLGGFLILSNTSSDGFIHEAESQNNTLAPIPRNIKTPAKRDIVPDSQETPVSAESIVPSSQDRQLSSGQVDPQARTEEGKTVSVADEESWEEPPSYRERAKYLEAEGIDNPPGSSSYQVNEHNSSLPCTPGRNSTEGLHEEVPADIFQEPGNEPESSNHSEVCTSDSEPIVQSLEQLTPFPAPSPVDSQEPADDPELPIPLQIEDDVDSYLVPALVDTPDSIGQETDVTEDLQFQTQVLYTAHSVNSSIQSTQEKPSSHESVISVARSSSARSSEVESSEPWQGGQIVPQVDLVSSESSHYQSYNRNREFEPVIREHQIARESLTASPAFISHRQTSPIPSQLDIYEDIPIAPQSEHVSLFESDHVIASVEEDLASPTFPPPHLIPSSGTPQLSETYEGDFLRRPDILSDHNMEGNTSPMEQNAPVPLSISERLRQIRAQSSTHMSTRSPSAIPERIPTPPTAHPGQMLPSKQHHIEPEESFAAIQPPLETVVEDNAELSEAQPLSEVPRVRKMEYRVPLPMVAFVRDVYAQAVKNCKIRIKDFVSASNVDSATVDSIDNLIDDLRKCSTHQDLLSEPSATQAATPDHVTAKWADTCSTKCIFLRHFLKEGRGLEAHVVILARPGKTLDIIESILKTDNISYDRPGDHVVVPISSIISPLKITLVPTGEEGRQYVIAHADMVIGFDDTFNASEDYVHRLRADLYGDRLAPLVSLIVVNSVEHLDFCIPRQMDAHTRKSILVRCIEHTVRVHEVGVAHPEDPSPDTCATRIAQYLADGAHNWPLLPPLEAAAVEIYLGGSTQDSAEQTTDNPEQGESGSTTQSHDTGAQAELQVPQSSLKRSWDISDEDSDNAKRLRATPQPEGDSSAESTRISDTTVDPSQVFSAPAEYTASLDIRSRHEKSFNDSPNSWQARISELEEQLRFKTNAELQLRADNERVRAENLQLHKDVAGHENGVKIMQPKFLEALQERAAAVHEAKLATEKLATITSRLETRSVELTKLKENETRLETELAAARQALATSAVPEIAELEKAHALAREYLEEKNKAERKFENKEKDFNFTRNSYQEYSSKCGELSTALSELKEQNAILARQADENKVAINKINHDQALDFHVQRINQLQNILKDREEELNRKSEELKVLKEGRRGTRGTSAPKSPMFNTGVHSPKVAGNRSRGVSPSIGDIGTAGASGGRDPVSFLSGGGTTRFAPLSRLRE